MGYILDDIDGIVFRKEKGKQEEDLFKHKRKRRKIAKKSRQLNRRKHV